MSRLALSALLVLSVAAPAFADESKPWSQILLGQPKASDPRQEPLVMIAIDGKRDFDPDDLYQLAPGRHEFVIAMDSTDTVGAMTYQTIAIDMQPCTNYELIARRRPGTSDDNRHWAPELRGETPVRRCRKKFGDAAAAPAP
ncbi:MAG: hypothetical protein ACTHOH_12000 [Lysobacteraceae bacterium]